MSFEARYTLYIEVYFCVSYSQFEHQVPIHLNDLKYVCFSLMSSLLFPRTN